MKHQMDDPCLARAIKEEPLILSDQIATRFRMPGDGKPRFRYAILGDLVGTGSFGIVHKCVEVDSGNYMAVKILLPPLETPTEQWKTLIKCEVDTLAGGDHVSRRASSLAVKLTDLPESYRRLLWSTDILNIEGGYIPRTRGGNSRVPSKSAYLYPRISTSKMPSTRRFRLLIISRTTASSIGTSNRRIASITPCQMANFIFASETLGFATTSRMLERSPEGNSSWLPKLALEELKRRKLMSGP